MPFSNTYARDILDYTFSKKTSLSAPAEVYIGLCTNDPEATNGTFEELSGGGYARVLISRRGDTYPNQMGSASGRSITNQYQINWTRATSPWIRANGFGLFSTPTGGVPFFYGALELTEEQKAAGGLLVEAGSVALFDPGALKIEFPAQDVAAE